VVNHEKLRELSRINGTLYEFLMPEEQKPSCSGEPSRVLKATFAIRRS